ncbi:MAG: helix-turn-helix domain-containing protein [Rikenellaceae bacterium]|nr:helix-turn-helix domain-containing protein [Rikenellaceae bacterium]
MDAPIKRRRGKVEGAPDKISIARIKSEMNDVSYLSDDLVITTINSLNYYTVMQKPITVDGFVAIILMSGEATISLNMTDYTIRPNNVVFFTPESIVDLKEYSDEAMAYILAFSKSFVNEIQVDLATSLPVYMRIGKDPILPVTSKDVSEIRQVFQLIKTLLRSDKERYRHEIIRSLFTTAFYIITELNQRERPSTRTKGRGEAIFEEFSNLLQQYNKRERNVGFYAKQLGITPKYLSSIVKEVSGKTAARWIDESVILEAKNLLKYSGMSIQEIAYHLNFSTQSFFGKYFKQHTGTSPSRFKRKG